MANFISIQNTYEQIEIALFTDNQLVDTVIESKLKASKAIITHLDALLIKHACPLSTLDFIAVNKGPGPFTTLRVVITTVNGLAFASGIPLVGINALDALHAEYADKIYPYTVCLLNAFGNDVYFSIHQPNCPPEIGCKNNAELMHYLDKKIPEAPIRFVGNGARMHAETIQTIIGTRAQIEESIATCSVKQVGKMGLAAYKNKERVAQIEPVYIKRAWPVAS